MFPLWGSPPITPVIEIVGSRNLVMLVMTRNLLEVTGTRPADTISSEKISQVRFTVFCMSMCKKLS